MKSPDIKDEEKRWKKEFSLILTKLIAEQGLTVNKLANAIDIDPKTITHYIDESSVPTIVILMRLADYLSVSIDYLVTGGKTGIQYSSRKEIYKLAERISGIDMQINNFDKLDCDGCQSVSVTIKDPFLAPIIIELCLTPQKDFISHAEQVIAKYADMETSKDYLTDPETFKNLIRDRYISDGFEFGVCDFDEDASEKYSQQWEQMSVEQREEWWKNWLEEHELSD